MGEEVFYSPFLEEGRIKLSAEETHHLKVKRIRKGERVILTDGEGRWVYAVLKEIKKEAELESEGPIREVAPSVFKACACIPLLKGSDTDFLVRTLAELGADVIYIFTSSRTVPSPSEDGVKKRMGRWRRIIVEACKQSRRFLFPKVEGILGFEDIIRLKDWELRVIMWEECKGTSVKEIMNKNFESILFVSGPEGGFENREIEEALSNGFIAVHLGDNILRARTAPIYFMSVVNFIRK